MPLKSVVILTGASKGLGAALARLTAGAGISQVLAARDAAALREVGDECRRRGSHVIEAPLDLLAGDAEARLDAACDSLDWRALDRVLLINNASAVLPIRRLTDLTAAETRSVVDLNLSAAIWVTSLCLRRSRAHGVARVDVLNVSTGVSLNPLVGWSLYCSSKAGVNLLTRCTARETADWTTPVVRAVAVNPGPIDTGMQRDIRAASAGEFPDRQRFVNLFEQGGLADPDRAAAKVLAVLSRDPFPQGEFVDLRDQP